MESYCAMSVQWKGLEVFERSLHVWRPGTCSPIEDLLPLWRGGNAHTVKSCPKRRGRAKRRFAKQRSYAAMDEERGVAGQPGGKPSPSSL